MTADHSVPPAEEAGSLITFASDWLELDSSVEGIRFDAELVCSLFALCLHRSTLLTSHVASTGTAAGD